MINIKHRIINLFKSRNTKEQLLSVYIPIITDNNSNKLTIEEIHVRLKEDFNYLVTLDDIKKYFEANFYENVEDIQQQIKNLNIRYD